MKCCFCGKDIMDYGNDPWPADMADNSRCCDDCNMKIVIPARIKALYEKHDKEEMKMDKQSDKVIAKIINKEELTRNELNMLKCILAGYEAYDEKLNEVLGITNKEENK